jgi:YHS domain-containing protein
MANVSSLADRIDAEFSAVEGKYKSFQAEQVREYQERQERLRKLAEVLDELREVWGPRLEVLVKKFGDRVQAKPRLTPSTREGTFEFQSELARVRLKFSASTDRDVRKVVLAYDLEIIPVLLRFQPHAELEFPLEAVDREAAGRWIDDRVVDFVRTYLSLGENDVYLKDHMVEDPVAHVRFPKFAAGATLQWQGRTYYFIGEETRREFARQNGLGAEGPAGTAAGKV